ncbi:MAG: hypothetical protein KJ709_02355 [Nanoarchaeota archaeon]|nr:hypothetical protein [Nanoarchaeota archaeon]
MGAIKGLTNLAATIIASLVLIFLGIVYFMITMWVIKIGASWAGLSGVTGNMILITAGIVSAATIVASAIQR